MRRPLRDGVIVLTVAGTVWAAAHFWWLIPAVLWAGLAALIWGKGSRR